MSRIIKIIDNKYVQIEGYCNLKEIFDPFEIFYKIEELKSKIYKLEDKNQELNKQLEDANEKIFLLKHSKTMLDYKKALEETQQKEFIKYLEDEIQNCEAVSDLLFNSNREMKVYKEILQKYREMVNGSKQS